MNDQTHETADRQRSTSPPTRAAFRARSLPASSSSQTATSSSFTSGRSSSEIGDADVRMLAYNGSIPGPTLKVPKARPITVHVDERGRPRGDGALARLAAREPLRRDTRHAGANPGRGDFHVPGARPRSRRVLVPPSHPRGLRPGDGAVREHPRRPGRSGLLAAGQPRAVPDAGRRPHRGREDRRLQRLGDDTCCDGPVRQRHARLGRARPRADR